MMHKQDNISLIIRDLTNETNLQESEKLKNLLEKDSELRQTQDDITKIWDISGNYTPNVTIDTKSAFDKFATNYDLPIDSQIDTAGKTVQVKQYVALAITALLIITSSFFVYNALTSDSSVENNSTINSEIVYNNQNVVLSPGSKLIYDSDNVIKDVVGRAYFTIDNTNTSNNTSDTNSSNNGTNNNNGSISNVTDSNSTGNSVTSNSVTSNSATSNSATNNISKAFTEIYLGNAKLTAEKASFAVKHKQGNEIIEISVEKGLVKYNYDGKVIDVSKDNMLIVNTSTNQIELKSIDANTDNSLLWAQGYLTFNGTHLSEVFTDIEDFFGIQIDGIDAIPSNCHCTTPSPEQSTPKEVFNLLQESIKFNYKRTGKLTYEISNIRCD